MTEAHSGFCKDIFLSKRKVADDIFYQLNKILKPKLKLSSFSYRNIQKLTFRCSSVFSNPSLYINKYIFFILGTEVNFAIQDLKWCENWHF